jgi:competence protein ComEC
MIAEHKSEIPVVTLLPPFVAGIALGMGCLSGANANWLLFVFFSVALLFIALNFYYTQLGLYKSWWAGGLLITALLFLAGWQNVIRYNELNNSNHFSKTTAQFLVVKISSEPGLKNNISRFTANVEQSISKGKKLPVTGTLLVAIKDSAAGKLYYGDELLIPAKYTPVEPPYVPASFNYKNYLAGQNIFYQAFFTPKQHVLLQTDAGNPLIAYSLRLRQRLVAKLKSNMHDTAAIAVASTLILGYKADLSSDILQAYSKTGTVHVLSVSGAHVAIIYILLTLAFGFLDRHKFGKLLKAVIMITMIWYYSLLSGFSPAVCRAAVMISMVIIGKTFNRYINTLNILAISAFLLLLYDPFFIADVGFQLSYLAVFGLIVFQPVVYKWLVIKNKWADKLWALCSVSIAAQVVTFPLSAFYFHQFPVYFLISNLFIMVPTAVIMYAGLLFLLLPQIPVVSSTIAYILEKSIVFMNKGLEVIEHSPYAGISKIWITVPEYLLLYAIIISGFYFLYNKNFWLVRLCLICTLFLCGSWCIKKINATGSSTIAWLNLGKHQGIVFRSGHEAIIFSDLKPLDKKYQYSIQPYLDSCQAEHVETLNLNQDIKTPWMIKKGNFIQFLNKRIMIFDGKQQNNLFSEKLKTDYIYITGNPVNMLSKINNIAGKEMLIVDGNNADYLTSGIMGRVKARGIRCKILKRNNSVISTSN